jgi:hypothetical protein
MEDKEAYINLVERRATTPQVGDVQTVLGLAKAGRPASTQQFTAEIKRLEIPIAQRPEIGRVGCSSSLYLDVQLESRSGKGQ